MESKKFPSFVKKLIVSILVLNLLFPVPGYSTRQLALQNVKSDVKRTIEDLQSETYLLGGSRLSSPLLGVRSEARDQAAHSVGELLDNLKGVMEIVLTPESTEKAVRVLNQDRLQVETVQYLAREASLNKDADIRAAAQRILRETGLALGIKEASIHPLYMARQQDKWSNLTVPAYNVRVWAFETMQRIIRAMLDDNAGPFILELAGSERRYTQQNQAEYMAMAYAAAIAQGYVGPLFGQGDHYQVNAKNFFNERAADPAKPIKDFKAVKDVEKLIHESIAAGKRNIDVDPSTLVDDKILEKILQLERQYVDRYIEGRSQVDPEFAQDVAHRKKEKGENDSSAMKSLRRQLVEQLEVGLQVQEYQARLSAPEVNYLKPFDPAQNHFGLSSEEKSGLVDLYRQMHQTSFEVSMHFLRFIRSLEKELGLNTPISVGVEERHIDNKKHAEFPSTVLGSVTIFRQVIDAAEREGLVIPSKLALQTGAMHGLGGDVDWGIFERHQFARKEIGTAVFVQHGTSTLNPDDFQNMPRVGSGEAHLATEYQKISLETIAKFEPELREKMTAFLEGLIYPDRPLTPEIEVKLKEAGLFDAVKRKTDYTDKFQKKWEDALAQPGKTREQILIEILGDSLEGKLKGSLKDLVKELSGPFKEEIWNLPFAVQMSIRTKLYQEFRRINAAQNVKNSRYLLALTEWEKQNVVLPPRPDALQKAIEKNRSEVRDNQWRRINYPNDLAAVLKDLADLNAEEIQATVLRGQLENDLLADEDTRYVFETSVSQSFGSIVYAGQGKEKAKIADKGAVSLGEMNLINSVNTHHDTAVVVLGDEGSRLTDKSYSLDMASIYHHRYKGSVRKFNLGKTNPDGTPRNTEEIRASFKAFRQEVENLRRQSVKIRFQVSDALEHTAGLVVAEAVSQPTNSWSLTALFDEFDTLSDDDFRMGGISFNAPTNAGVTPFDLPSEALPKIAADNQVLVEQFINHTIVAFLGPRQAKKDYEKAGEKHRHQAIIDDAARLKQIYPGLRIAAPGDGDLIFRILASTGIPLTFNGQEYKIVTFGRSGVQEATAGAGVAADIPNGQFSNSHVSEKATGNNYSAETAYQYTQEEDDRHNQLGISNHRTPRDRSFIKGKSIVAMTAVTGAPEEYFGKDFADALQRVTFIAGQGKEGKVTTNTLLVTPKGDVLVLRTTFATPDLEATKVALQKITESARSEVRTQPETPEPKGDIRFYGSANVRVDGSPFVRTPRKPGTYVPQETFDVVEVLKVQQRKNNAAPPVAALLTEMIPANRTISGVRVNGGERMEPKDPRLQVIPLEQDMKLTLFEPRSEVRLAPTIDLSGLKLPIVSQDIRKDILILRTTNLNGENYVITKEILKKGGVVLAGTLLTRPVVALTEGDPVWLDQVLAYKKRYPHIKLEAANTVDEIDEKMKQLSGNENYHVRVLVDNRKIDLELRASLIRKYTEKQLWDIDDNEFNQITSQAGLAETVTQLLRAQSELRKAA